MFASTTIVNNPALDSGFRLKCRYYMGIVASFDGAIVPFQLVVYRDSNAVMVYAIDYLDENNLKSEPTLPIDVAIGGDDSTQGINVVLRLGTMTPGAYCVFYSN